MKSRLTEQILLAGALLTLVILAYSIAKVGYFYRLDNDELFNTQLTYLIASGYTPYKDIYMSVYTPLFQWVLMPAYILWGFTFQTIFFTRYIILLLYGIRIVAGVLMLRITKSWRAGLIFSALLLADPISTYPSLQIRQDNLMMTLFALGLVLLTRSTKASIHLTFWGSALIGASVVSLMKIAPSAAAILGVLTVFYLYTRKYDRAFAIISGAALPVLLFSAYTWTIGAWSDMVRQVILESVTSYTNVFEYAISPGFFYRPDNTAVYGLTGKPLHWLYASFLPILGAGGAMLILRNALGTKSFKVRDALWTGIVVGFVGQWLFLHMVESVFIQHYLPLTWYYAVFGAVAVDELFSSLDHRRAWRIVAYAAVLFMYVILAHSSYTGNIARSWGRSDDIVAEHTRRWSQIPAGAPVFPNYLFRPLAYPVPYGHFLANIPPSILTRIGNICDTLSTGSVPYVMIDDYLLDRLDPEVRECINDRYVKVAATDIVYILKSGE